VFGQTLLALKIYSARNRYYTFSALIASAPSAHGEAAGRAYASIHKGEVTMRDSRFVMRNS